MNSLQNNSAKSIITPETLWISKGKFFSYRLISYFALLLFPTLIPQITNLHPLWHYLLVILYMVFLFSQFYLLTKEIDYRFKIFVKTSSSLDRTIYRLVAGQIMMILYFSFCGFFIPINWRENFFWFTWIMLGLYYSWPTRGKIIKESISSDFTEYKFLDGFEKTALFLILFTVLVSIPSFPKFDSIEVLRLYLDPKESIHNLYWNFLGTICLPFAKFPSLNLLGHIIYLYIVFSLFFLLSLYSLTRSLLNRRLALLTVYALVSSWSYSKILQLDFLEMITCSLGIIWLWFFSWSIRANNYRAGLYLGMLNILLTLFHPSFLYLFFFQFILIYFYVKNGSTPWFKSQFIRYTLFGGLISTVLFFTHYEQHFIKFFFSQFLDRVLLIIPLIQSKSIYALSLAGIFIIFYSTLSKKFTFIKQFKDQQKIKDYQFGLISLVIMAIFFVPSIISSLFFLLILSFLAMVPLDAIFINLQNTVSTRNIIYLSYILFCLLDSNLEGRIKILLTQMSNLAMR